MARLVFGLGVVGGDLGMGLGQQQSHIFDGTGLADARGAVDERPRGPVAQTAHNELMQLLDGRCGDTVVASGDGMQVGGDRPGHFQRHQTSPWVRIV